MQEPHPTLRRLVAMLPEAKVLFRFTSWALPDIIKKKIVMVATFCEVERLRGVKEARVDKLNKALDIIDTESLLYCIRDLADPLSKEFYSCQDEPCHHDMVSLVHHLVTRTPEWLRYADQETMMTDVAKVVAFNVE